MLIISLVITAPVKCLILLDNAPLGEAGGGDYISLAAAPDSIYYITALPLVKGYMPITRAIELNGERLVPNLEKDVCAIEWQTGVIQIELTPEKIAEKLMGQGGTLQTMRLVNGFVVTLFYDNGVHVAVEQGNQLIFSQTVAPSGAGTITVEGDENVIVIAHSEEGDYCLLLKLIDDVEIILSVKADNIHLENNNLICIEKLKTYMGHERRRVYTIRGEMIKAEIGFYTHRKKELMTAEDGAIALMDCINHSIEAELPQLLAGNLTSLSLGQLKEFFGLFDHAEIAPCMVCDKPIIGLIGDGQIEKARLFAFESEIVANIVKISNVEEIG